MGFLRQTFRLGLLTMLAILGIIAFAVIILSRCSVVAYPVFPDHRVFASCIYKVKVMVFTDANGDGVQNSGELGIAGGMVTLEHAEVLPGTPEVNTTDTDGQTVLQNDTFCSANDRLTVRVTPPSGYIPTTPLIFGPYPVPEYVPDSMTEVAAHPIPNMIYVGLAPT